MIEVSPITGRSLSLRVDHPARLEPSDTELGTDVLRWDTQQVSHGPIRRTNLGVIKTV
jgi:hypothetical protein